MTAHPPKPQSYSALHERLRPLFERIAAASRVIPSSNGTSLLFARQGIGRLMLDAANSKDVPLLLGITLLAAAIYVVVNFLVDLINHWVDPRAKAV
ncbi:ABC transporter permease subunit [Pseudomonas chlororaphis]|uniref:ABC transporter permease subunit n=1 Tax=Pseudomonas chlororaphis TaxID=587753 RepID=UPI001FF0D563|nr:ABC transporter permease subunit [Pseudomonas chlororaphis]